jgi:uncharacterized membrane protein
MSHDNVTPFRRPPPRPVRPQQQGGMGFKTHRGKAVLVHVLTIACFVVPFFLMGVVGPQAAQLIGFGIGLAGVLVAYSSRDSATPWAATHHEQAMRTIIIASILITALSLPRLVVSQEVAGFWNIYGPIAFWTWVVIVLWGGLRAVVGLVLAGLRRPVFKARGWLL